jgi:hypothetical protein
VLNVGQIATLRQCARLLANDRPDPRDAASVAALLELAPKPVKPQALRELQVTFVSVPSEAAKQLSEAQLTAIGELLEAGDEDARGVAARAVVEVDGLRVRADAAERERDELRGMVDELRKRLEKVGAELHATAKKVPAEVRAPFISAQVGGDTIGGCIVPFTRPDAWSVPGDW